MPIVVEMVKRLGVRYIGVIKTSYATYPKKIIEETMENWPAGSHLVLETKKMTLTLLQSATNIIKGK